MAIAGKPESEPPFSQAVRVIPHQICINIQDIKYKGQIAGPVEINDSDLMGLRIKSKMFVSSDSVWNCCSREISA